MALSADGNWVTQEVENVNSVSMLVLNAAVIYNTALCSHGTTSGEIKPFDGTQADRLVGWAHGSAVTGATAAPDNAGRITAKINPGGFIVKGLTVATLAGDATDIGKPVYATDDATYTITDPTSGQVVGHVVASEDNTAAVADVHFRNLAAIIL